MEQAKPDESRTAKAAETQVYVVEVRSSPGDDPSAFRASVRPVETEERQYFDSAENLGRFFAERSGLPAAREGDDGRERRS